jgi:hypothetical protein
MNNTKFENIWRDFEWVLNDMRDGMVFLEGYLLKIKTEDLINHLRSIDKAINPESFQNPTWANKTTEKDWNKIYSPEEYVRLFKNGDILTLHFNYKKKIESDTLEIKLMFAGAHLEVVCYRDPILNSANPKQAIKAFIIHCEQLLSLFEGDSLFIGPDTLSYPDNAQNYPKEWIKIK